VIKELTTIYTIGHSNHDFNNFIDLIDGMEVVVDLRSAPYSKYVPHFNKEDLKRGLEALGTGYVFMKDKNVGNIIGGRPNDEDCYPFKKISYELVKKKEWYGRGIRALIDIAEEKRTVVMCSEEDPYRCHRHHLIAQSLLENGLMVTHIIKDGRWEKAEGPGSKGTFQQTLI